MSEKKVHAPLYCPFPVPRVPPYYGPQGEDALLKKTSEKRTFSVTEILSIARMAFELTWSVYYSSGVSVEGGRFRCVDCLLKLLNFGIYIPVRCRIVINVRRKRFAEFSPENKKTRFRFREPFGRGVVSWNGGGTGTTETEDLLSVLGHRRRYEVQ